MEEIKPIRIQRSRKVKQVSPNGLPIVYVGRPSEFGNPFKKGQYAKIGLGGNGMKYLIANEEKYTNGSFNYLATIKDAVKMYDDMLRIYPLKEKEIILLKGKNLSCWCKIGQPCHADILLEIANKGLDKPTLNY